MNSEKFLTLTGGLSRFQLYAIFWMGYSRLLCAIMILLPIYVNYLQPIYCHSSNKFDYSKIPQMTNENKNLFNNSIQIDQHKCEFDVVQNVCDNLTHLQEPMKNTIRMKYKLYCKEYFMYPTFASSSCMGGIFIGSLILGYISDKFGRLITLSLSSILCFIFSIVGGFTTYFWVHFSSRFVVGIGTAGLFSAGNSYILEVLPIRYRLPLSLIALGGFNVGGLVCCFIGYFVRDGTYIQLTGALCTIPGFFYYFALPESFKWLISVNCKKKALTSLKYIAKFNGIKLNTEELKKDIEIVIENIKNENDAKNLDQFQNIIKFKKIRIYFMIFCYLFFVTSLIFYGLSLGAGKFSTNIFIGAFGVSISTVISRVFLVLICVYLGRVSVLSFLYLGTFILLIIGGVLKWSSMSSLAVLVCLTGATIFVESAFSLLWLFCGELFPSAVRTTSVSFGSALARIGGFLASYFLMLEAFYPGIFFLICSAFVAMAFLATFFKLPESRGLPTFDSLNEAEVRLKTKENLIIKRFKLMLKKN